MNQFHTGIACGQFIFSREDWLKSVSAEREKGKKKKTHNGAAEMWRSVGLIVMCRIQRCPDYAQNADNVSEMFPFKFP